MTVETTVIVEALGPVVVLGAKEYGQQSALSSIQPTTGAQYAVGPSRRMKSGVEQYPCRRTPAPEKVGMGACDGLVVGGPVVILWRMSLGTDAVVVAAAAAAGPVRGASV